MIDDRTDRRWVLTGPWWWLHRLSLVLLPLIAVVAAVVLVLAYLGTNPPPWWLPVIFAVGFGTGFWVQIRSATEVVLEPDATLVFHRLWLRPVRVPAASVRSIGRPAIRGRRAGVRVRAAEVTVPLAYGMPDVRALVDIVVRHSPALRVGML